MQSITLVQTHSKSHNLCTVDLHFIGWYIYTVQLHTHVLIHTTVIYVCTSRELSEAEVLHGASGDQRFLRVVEHVCQSVHPDVEVCDVDSHGLLAHGRLVGVSGRLVVVREGYDAGTDTCTGGRGEDKSTTCVGYYPHV